ncbi:unnamed protein product [Ectocarpus sp. 6 AP-2014]
MPRVFTRRYMTVELYSRHQQQNVFYTALKCFSSEGIQKRCLFSPKAKLFSFFWQPPTFYANHNACECINENVDTSTNIHPFQADVPRKYCYRRPEREGARYCTLARST